MVETSDYYLSRGELPPDLTISQALNWIVFRDPNRLDQKFTDVYWELVQIWYDCLPMVLPVERMSKLNKEAGRLYGSDLEELPNDYTYLRTDQIQKIISIDEWVKINKAATKTHGLVSIIDAQLNILAWLRNGEIAATYHVPGYGAKDCPKTIFANTAIFLYQGEMVCASQQDNSTIDGLRIETNSLNLKLNSFDKEAEVDIELKGTKSGAKKKWDWSAYCEVADYRYQEVGYPGPQNVDGWQSQADLARFLMNQAQKDYNNNRITKLPSDDSCKRYARKLMEKWSSQR